MVKETKNLTEKGEFGPHALLSFWSVAEGDIGYLLALMFRYKLSTVFCHKPYDVATEPQSRAPLLLHTGHFIHSHNHTLELVEWKTCSLG